MSAALFGEQLLSEIHSESLHELLHDLKLIHNDNLNANDPSTKSSLGIPELDALLTTFTPSPSQPPVIEIASTASAAGKSHLLYHLAATAVLPRSYQGVHINGHESAIVYIDTDHRFDADRLYAVAREIVLTNTSSPSSLSSSSPDIQNHDLHNLILSSLRHIHLFRPLSSSSLLSTLHSLKPYLLTHSPSSPRPFKTLFLDSASSFIYPDKLRDELSRVEEIGCSAEDVTAARKEGTSFVIGDLYGALVAALRSLQGFFGCAVLFTCVSDRGASAAGSGGPVVGFRSPLPPPWGSFPGLRLVVARGEEGRVNVNTWGWDEWPRRWREGAEEFRYRMAL